MRPRRKPPGLSPPFGAPKRGTCVPTPPAHPPTPATEREWRARSKGDAGSTSTRSFALSPPPIPAGAAASTQQETRSCRASPHVYPRPPRVSPSTSSHFPPRLCLSQRKVGARMPRARTCSKCKVATAGCGSHDGLYEYAHRERAYACARRRPRGCTRCVAPVRKRTSVAEARTKGASEECIVMGIRVSTPKRGTRSGVKKNRASGEYVLGQYG
jgi:hypothetical protein